MKKHSLSLASLVLFFVSIAFFTSCKRINEATELGGDLVPPVDNITTFDTTLTVETFNELFTDANDSLRVLYTDQQFLGHISNDPLFGKTTAQMFFELKPLVYPFSFAAAKDSMYIDSVVLVLGYAQTYGDSVTPQRFQVYQLDQSNDFRRDSSYLLRKNNLTYSNLLGTATVAPNTLNDSITLFRERAANQLRIKLNNSFGTALLQQDTATTFKTDSAFRAFNKGFAVVPDVNFGGNAVMGFNLTDTNTKLAVYYKFDKGGVRDTAVSYLKFNAGISAAANYVQRDYNGTPLASTVGGTTPDNLLFIQNYPGTYANINIPGLRFLTNRVVHRAELVVEEVFDPSDVKFPTPTALYLDAFDSAKAAFRAIPYDFNLLSASSTNAEAFGAYGKATTSLNGEPIRKWTFNLSTYVQNVVSGKERVHQLRLSAPYDLFELYKTRTSTTDVSAPIPINPTSTIGRVRVGGGNHPTQPMRLRIIYSRI